MHGSTQNMFSEWIKWQLHYSAFTKISCVKENQWNVNIYFFLKGHGQSGNSALSWYSLHFCFTCLLPETQDEGDISIWNPLF